MHPTIHDIYHVIDQLAPFSTAMGFDNPGFLIGDGDCAVQTAVIALDCTPQVLAAARAEQAQLIITHHPVIFHPLKHIHADSIVYQLIEHHIGVISAHTNLDMAQGGVNDCLALRLGLQNIHSFSTEQVHAHWMIHVPIPKEQVDAVRDAMAAAGAGIVGAYTGCACMIDSVSTVVPGPQAHPTVGSIGERAFVPEIQLQMTCPPDKLDAVLAAMKKAHPYETPSYSVFANAGKEDRICLGRMGTLTAPLPADSFARHVKNALGGSVRYAQVNHPIHTVAVCGGAGGDLWEECVRLHADALVTADVKHNIFLDAAAQGLMVLDAGHFHTEDVVIEPLRAYLQAQFPQVRWLGHHQTALQSL